MVTFPYELKMFEWQEKPQTSKQTNKLTKHRASIYNGHLWGPVTLTPIAERLAVELSLRVLLPMSVAAGIRTPNFLQTSL